jgi:Leucine-rich repeat (LRR) protein
VPRKEKTALFLAFFFVSISSLALAAAKSPDADAIADLARSVSNLPPSWTAGGDVCGYEGVTCDKVSGRVTAIDLGGKGVAGTLPPSSLSSLAALTELLLGGNALAGAVPSLAGLASLARVVLDGNNFTSLPADFLQDVPSMRDLRLNSLPLQPWSLPEAISSLENFSAVAASLTGHFPANLSSSSLKMLRLSNNNLSGQIDAVASLNGLSLLMIDHNSFSGPIPDLSGISQLEAFTAGDNLLTGLVPASMTTMPSLRRVSLVNNLLQGPMPEFSHGVVVNVVGNNFCRQEPGRPCDAQVTTLLQVAAGFGYPLQLAKKWHANTACNRDGTTTSTSWVGVICNGTDVTEISLERMNLSGNISPAFANLTALVRLNLSGNHLTGVIPDALAVMPRLALLDVTNNNLTGQIPKFKPSVQVMAQGNRFGESVPDTPSVPADTPAPSGVSSLPANSASRLNGGIIATVILALAVAWV